MDTTDGMDGENEGEGAGTEDLPQLPATVKNLLERVQDHARQRPLVALAAASGLGFVLGRGLPRIGGLVALLGVGGAVGFAMTALRRRMDGDFEDSAPEDESSEPEAAADTSDDAHDISVSSSLPDPNRSRRKHKKPNVVSGA
jgi:hypothetical protein